METIKENPEEASLEIIVAIRELGIEIEDIKQAISDIDKSVTSLIELSKDKKKIEKSKSYKCMCGIMVGKEYRTLHNKTKIHKETVKRMRSNNKQK